MCRTIFNWNRHHQRSLVVIKYHNTFRLLAVILSLDWACVIILFLANEYNAAALNVVAQAVFGIHASLIPFVFEGLKDLAFEGGDDTLTVSEGEKEEIPREEAKLPVERNKEALSFSIWRSWTSSWGRPALPAPPVNSTIVEEV